MKWKIVKEKCPKVGMVLVFTQQCLITQAYYNGECFYIPWGGPYPLLKQPKYWSKLPKPPTK